MSDEERSIIDHVSNLRGGVIRLKKNLRDWDFRYDYKLTRYERDVVMDLADFFDKVDDVMGACEALEAYEEAHKYDE